MAATIASKMAEVDAYNCWRIMQGSDEDVSSEAYGAWLLDTANKKLVDNIRLVMDPEVRRRVKPWDTVDQIAALLLEVGE